MYMNSISDSEKKQRIEYIDLAKGFCILFVVLYHIGGPFENADLNRIMSCFRMPLYYFLSGLFFKQYAGFFDFVLRKINKLIVPFVFFILIRYLIYCGMILITGDFSHISLLLTNIVNGFQHETVYLATPLWFLISLFETSLIFSLLSIISSKLIIRERNKDIFIALMSFFIGIIGYGLGVYHINLLLWLDTCMTAVPFYYTGYFLRNKTDLLVSNKLDKYIPVLLVLLGLIVYLFAGKIGMIYNVYSVNYFSFYISAISGTLFVLFISKMLKKVFLISFLGRYSIIVLCTHGLIIRVLNECLYFITNKWFFSIVSLSLIAFISIPVIEFFLRYFPKFVCQKDLIKVSAKSYNAIIEESSK